MFKVNVRTDRSSQWLEHSIVHLVQQTSSGTMGSEAILAKLAEALFVDALRRYVTDLPEQQQGWLAGARDPIVGKSLGLLHRRVNHPWTIADLAREVGVSRSDPGGTIYPLFVGTAHDLSREVETATGCAGTYQNA